MDINRLMALADEVAKVVPQDVIRKVSEALDGAEKVLSEVTDFVDETWNASVDKEKSQSIYDDVRNDVGNPPGSFEDIVAGFDAGPQATPDAESGGISLGSVLNTVYDYMSSNNLLKNYTILAGHSKAKVLSNYQYSLVYSFLRHLDNLHTKKFTSEF